MTYKILLQRFALLFAVIASILYIIPWHPSFPANFLDSSWQLGINQAVAQQLRFGTDIVFTLGPYAAIHTHQYHPATARLMFFGTALIATAFCCGMLRLTTRKNVLWLWVLPVLFGISVTANAFYQVLPLILLYIVGRTQLNAANEYRIELNGTTFITIFLLSAALGITVLSKASFIAPSLACCFFAILLAIKAHRKLALTIFIGFIAAVVTGWLRSGQALPDLPRYFISLPPLISGHTDAMSLQGPVTNVLIYIFSIIFFIPLFLRTSCFRENPPLQWIILTAFLLTSFLVFKSAFVRHDIVHETIAVEGLLLMAFLAGLQLRTPGMLVALLLAAVSWGAMENTYAKGFNINYWDRAQKNYIESAIGMGKFVAHPAWAIEQYTRSLATIRKKNPFSIDGTADIYSYNQAIVAANNIAWQPRPLFQSYIAYVPELARLNAEHLISSRAPENIIFRLQTIDKRYPSLDDSLSWPVIIENYSPQQLVRSGLILKRKPAAELPAPRVLDEEWIFSGQHQLGAIVELPNGSGKGLWAELEIRPTWMGQVFSFLYKLPQLQLKIHRKDGVIASFRFVAASGREGFLLSPYVGDTASFSYLFGEGFSAMDGLTIDKIELSGSSGSSLFWSNSYQLKIKYFQPYSTPAVDLSLPNNE